MSNIDQSIFKAYDIRGIYPDEIGPETVYHIARAFGKYLLEDLKEGAPLKVALGQDMRPHSPFLAKEAVHGLNDSGIDVIDLGRVPTLAFYYAVAFKDLAGGLMITASHNPKEYNGIKLCTRRALPIGRDSGMDVIQKYALAADWPKVTQADRGSFTSYDKATQDYVAQDLSYLNTEKIAKFTVAADPANAMGSLYLEELFHKIPADLIKLNWQLNGNMPIHEANPLKSETLQQLQEVIRNENADFGIAPDGDGDRIGLLDEKGDIIPPAIILGLLAKILLKTHPGEKIGYDLRLSRVAREMIEEAGGKPIETMVGHALIKKLMQKEDVLFSGELSMHYYYRENFYYESPVFVIAQLLLLRSILNKPFSEIWRPYLKYAQSEEINFEVADKQAIMKQLEEKYASGKISRLDGVKVDFPDWWFSVRASNTEPYLRLIVEAKDDASLQEKIQELRGLIQP